MWRVSKIPSNVARTVCARLSEPKACVPSPKLRYRLRLWAMEGDEEFSAINLPEFGGPEFEAMLGLPGTISTKRAGSPGYAAREFCELGRVAGLAEVRRIACMVNANFDLVKRRAGQPAGKMPPFDAVNRSHTVAVLHADFVPDWAARRVNVRIKMHGFGVRQCQSLRNSMFLEGIRGFAAARSLDTRGTIL